jgi:4-aminobutyrate aminotransferase
VIRDVRGLGLMVGVEFFDRWTGDFAKLVSDACLRQGMLMLTTSSFPAIRFIPPLNVSKDELQLGLEIFEKAVVLTKSSVTPKVASKQ